MQWVFWKKSIHVEVNAFNQLVEKEFHNEFSKHPLKQCLVQSNENERIEEQVSYILAMKVDEANQSKKKPLDKDMQRNKSKPINKLKNLSKHL